MEDEVVMVDGREIRIRPMDQEHIISECAHQRAEGKTSRQFRRFHVEIMRRYGNAGIIALCENKIVGFLNFYPNKLNRKKGAPMCAAFDEGKRAQALDAMDWPPDAGDTLSISCINLDQSLLRKGIGTRLVKMAVEWARENGYRAVHAGANDTRWWIPCKPFYEKIGFHVIETREFDPPREDGELREYTMEILLER